ncbi:MAG: hypothetical protein K2P99_01340 [Burkholderiales bacterium]|nr:hypothetical protein [Burkholderiales bacterium]
MLAHNFIRKSNMNVTDVLHDNVPEKIYSSILFTLVNLPYKANSIDIEPIFIDNVEYKSFKNHYRFNNGTMTIIKIASTEFVPYGIYARKIINFLIAEFSYKYTLPHIYDCDQSRRMVKLGKKPIDFIEKICGRRTSGSSSAKSILQQLQAILNCRMAVATGYKQINPNNDELFASDKYQFALIESDDDQLVNHKFDVFNNWQPEIYITNDLADMFSRKIMPIDRDVYMKITSPMELDIFQYFSYQGYNKDTNYDYPIDWNDVFGVFGRGYASTSVGIAGFRRDFRRNVASLMQKTNLVISAPLDAKYITFRPQVPNTTIKCAISVSEASNNDLYASLKPTLDILPKIGTNLNKNNWDDFIAKYDLLRNFDKGAITIIKEYFESDAEQTKKTIEYVKIQKPRKVSAYLVSALKKNWLKFNEYFEKRLESWERIYDKLTGEQKRKVDSAVSTAIPKLRDKWLQEQIDSRILTLIYARYLVDEDRDLLLKELTGSRYQTYFMRDHNLFNLV